MLPDGSDGSLPLVDAFLNPPAYTDNGALSPEQAAGAVLMGSSDQVGNELDEFLTERCATGCSACRWTWRR